MDLFEAGKNYLKYHIFGKRIPLNVSISVTNRCNLRCSYCDIYNRDQAEMSKEKIFQILDDLEEMGCYRVGFWGGEPLVRKDIGELIEHAVKRNLFTTLISNGVLVPEKINEIKKLDTLFLSLDGPKETHEKNKGKGTFEKIINAIKVARENDIPVTTITVLTDNNEEKVNFILDKGEDLDFTTTFQLIYRDSELTSKNKEPAPNYESIIKKLIQKKEEGARIASSKTYLKHILKWEDYSTTALYPTNNKKIKCYGGKLFCNIDTDGKVYPCDWMIRKIEEPNASKLGFKKAWDKLKLPKRCGGCLKSCYSEYNSIFSLKFEAVKNVVNFVKK